ncbi:GM22854 [Drosophila sechellia]|uniref:GM22854 n=1 Tax=Drosophila sechellia TaxID=7238 RepID=B4I6J5_DROSE|nr:GM22854 [Drosophila sechellia]
MLALLITSDGQEHEEQEQEEQEQQEDDHEIWQRLLRLRPQVPSFLGGAQLGVEVSVSVGDPVPIPASVGFVAQINVLNLVNAFISEPLAPPIAVAFVGPKFLLRFFPDSKSRGWWQETWAVAVRNEDVKLGGSAVGYVDVDAAGVERIFKKAARHTSPLKSSPISIFRVILPFYPLYRSADTLRKILTNYV